jgi:hypothetical protein
MNIPWGRNSIHYKYGFGMENGIVRNYSLKVEKSNIIKIKSFEK